MSEPDEGEYDVPRELRAGAWANDVDVFGDVDELTLDFVRTDPRGISSSVLVSRETASRWCILKLQDQLDRRVS